MNKKTALKAVFALCAIAFMVTGISWASSLLLMKLHHLDLSLAGPFTVWQYWTVYHSHPDTFVKVSVNACAFGPWVLLALLALAAVLSHKQRSLHGDARFATLAEVRKAGLIDPPKGLDQTILVGKFKGHYLTYGGYQFVMLAAPTRSGKGVGVVIPNCLNYSDSLVVLDIKLENFDVTSGYRAAHGQEVYLFAPFDVNGRTHRYNPLEYISDDPAARIGDIDAIATALYSGGSDSDKFWNDQAKDMFRGICLMVLEHPRLPRTLGEILRQASGKGKSFKDHVQDMIEEAQKEERPFSSGCLDALNRVTKASDNTLANIVSTFNSPLLIFQNPRVDLATSANDFDLRDVRRKRMTVYLGVTPDKLKDAAVIVNLFFDQLLNLNTRTLPQQDKSLQYQCLLILDEFTAIGKVAMIQQSISYQAGYNMRVLTIIQNKSQLEDKYGKSGALTLMANHALMVMYAPSPVVQSDANEYSEMLGYQTVKSRNKSRSFGKGGSRSESESDQRRALMLPQELKELGQWREIVSLENCKPIYCDKIKYFEDPDFTSRTNWKVPDIPVQDVDAFVAKTEDRRRDFTADDLKDPLFAERVAGYDDMPELRSDIGELSEDDLEACIDEAADQISEHVLREPIDREGYRMEEDQAAELSSSIFGTADDGEDGEAAIEIEEAPAAEPAADVSGEDTPDGGADSDGGTLGALAAFGFTAEGSDEALSAGENPPAAEDDAESPEQAAEAHSEAVSEETAEKTPETEKTENTEETEPPAEAAAEPEPPAEESGSDVSAEVPGDVPPEDSPEEVAEASEDGLTDVMNVLGLEGTEDEESAPGADERKVMEAFGLAGSGFSETESKGVRT